ncbi:MAG: BamA/TamA family outer membrane protein [Candidatus Cloacimonetes bacterium]|nr:BamA/TamA family outer membrane protein [Candidatus Cloacimonadota bacterium]
MFFIKRKEIALLCFLLMFACQGFAYSDTTNAILNAMMNPRYIIVPAFSYASETNFVFGIGLYINPGVSDKETDCFTFDSIAKYSLKKQFELHLRPTYKFRSWQAEIDAKLRKWPDTFYGIGNETLLDDAEDYTTDKYMFKLNFFRKFEESLSLGVSTDWEHYNFSGFEEDGVLSSGNISGSEASEITGLGAVVRFDNTDSPYFPYSGFRFQVDALRFDSAFSSDYNFNFYHMDLRSYYSTYNKTVIANQFDMQVNQGDVPFYKLAKLGEQLRAYPSNRFVDKNSISFRTESRFLFPKSTFLYPFGYVIFVETGMVAPNISDFTYDDLKYSVGTGLRYTVIEKNTFNLQCDIAWGKEGYQIIIGGKEEF